MRLGLRSTGFERADNDLPNDGHGPHGKLLVPVNLPCATLVH